MKKIFIFSILICILIILYVYKSNRVSLNEQIFIRYYNRSHEPNYVYTLKDGRNVILCELNHSKDLMFCIKYKNLPPAIFNCLLNNSEIVFYNFSSYKLCGDKVLDMGNMEIIAPKDNSYIYGVLKLSNNYAGRYKAKKIDIEPQLNISNIHQGKLRTCGYFSLLEIYDYYNETKKSNYMRNVIYNNLNKEGVTFNELERIITYLNDSYDEIHITPFYDYASSYQKNLLNNHIPIIISSKYIDNCCLHSRVLTGYDDTQKIVYILDSSEIYGMCPCGDVVFSYDFFNKLLVNGKNGLILKINS